MSQHTTAEHIEMMKAPDRWPHSYILPLVRRSHPQENSWPQEGVLYQPSGAYPCPPPEPVVYLGNMYEGDRIRDREKLRYDSLEALAADGWEVD